MFLFFDDFNFCIWFEGNTPLLETRLSFASHKDRHKIFTWGHLNKKIRKIVSFVCLFILMSSIILFKYLHILYIHIIVLDICTFMIHDQVSVGSITHISYLNLYLNSHYENWIEINPRKIYVNETDYTIVSRCSSGHYILDDDWCLVLVVPSAEI